MSTRNLYRIVGVAAILSALIDFKDYFLSDPDTLGTKFDYYTYLANNGFLVLIAIAFYFLYNRRAKGLSIIAITLSALGFIMPLVSIQIPDNIFTWVFAAEHVIPILIFGILAYRYHQLGMPRVLGIIGILYAIVQIIYYILYNISPNLNIGIVDYFPGLLDLVWLIWTGGIFLFVYKIEIDDNIISRHFTKDVILVAGTILLILVGAFIYSKIYNITTAGVNASVVVTPVGYGVEFPFELDPVKEWGQKNVNVTCEDSIDQNTLEPDTVRQLVAEGGKLLIEPANGASPYYIWIGNVPLELFVEPEEDGTGYGAIYDYSGIVYCVSGTGVYAGVNNTEPSIYVITKLSEPSYVYIME